VRAQRTLWSVLSKTTPSQRSEAFSWLLYNVAGATLPIWLGGYILLPVLGKHFSWIEYSQHGELALYSAALLAPTIRVIARDVGESEFVRRQTFLFLGLILITGSVALYSGILAVAGVLPTGAATVGTTINSLLLFRFSFSLLVMTVMISFVVRLIDYQRIEGREILDLQDANEKRLESDFDKIAPQSTQPPTAEPEEPGIQQPGPKGDADTTTALNTTDPKLDRDFDAQQGADDGRREKD
jgi:hypothetical protein